MINQVLIVQTTCLIGIICCLIGLKKSDVTCKNSCLILEAILLHNLDVICQKKESEWEANVIDYDCVKPFNEVFFNIFDWGYKHIVPPDVYRKIEPYIEQAKEK